MMNTLKAANQVGLDVTVSIPLTRENAGQIDELLTELDHYQTVRISCFVPHCEGRGRLLEKVRLTLDDYEHLSDRVKGLFNRERFRPEREWVHAGPLPESESRVLTVTLTPDNVDFFEKMDFASAIAYLEELDDTYYQVNPGFEELLAMYGDPDGMKMYSARDLYMYYQKKYIDAHNIEIYDINDERQCFSRRM